MRDKCTHPNNPRAPTTRHYHPIAHFNQATDLACRCSPPLCNRVVTPLSRRALNLEHYSYAGLYAFRKMCRHFPGHRESTQDHDLSCVSLGQAHHRNGVDRLLLQVDLKASAHSPAGGRGRKLANLVLKQRACSSTCLPPHTNPVLICFLPSSITCVHIPHHRGGAFKPRFVFRGVSI